MKINEVRGLFPHIKKGKIYFNHAATGPLSTRVLSALNVFLINSSEGKIDDYSSFLKLYAESKEKLGNYLKCSPGSIAYLDNTTNGINVIANSFEWQKGDHILLNDIEFPANVYPFLNLQRRGVIIDFVKSEGGIVSAEDIMNSLTDSTRLVSVSQVQFLSGYRINLELLGKECRARGILLCVDAIQGLGAVRLDVNKCKIDFLSCGIQKWMLGLQGLSFIYVSEELQRKLVPANIGWLSVKNAWNHLEYKLDLKETAEVFQTGTISTAGLVSLNASLNVFSEFGYENVEKNVLDNSEYLRRQLCNTGLIPMADAPREFLSGIVTVRHNNAQKIYEYLEENNITCAVREGALRISPHFYNTKEDIDQFINILKKVI